MTQHSIQPEFRSGRKRAHSIPLVPNRRRNRRNWHSRLRTPEALERRELLANNILASVELPFTDASTTRDIDMTVTIPNAPALTRALLMVEISAANGSTFDPASITAADLNGTRFPVLSSIEDYRGTNSNVSIISVPAGTTRIRVDGEGSTTGRFVAKVSLVGDLRPDAGIVSEFEGLYASAALLQAQGGGNFVTKTFYASKGIDMSANLYDAGLDSNGDGIVDSLAVQSAQQNVTTRNVTVTLKATDGEPPEITSLGLVTDDGVSNTDKITSDPTISGKIEDADSNVTVFKAKLDNGAFQDFVASIDAKTSTFTFDQTKLNSLAGGTLAEGAHTLELLAADEFGNAIAPNTKFEFVFINPNAAPTISNLPQFAGAKEDELFKFGAARFFNAGDPGDKLTFSLAPTNGVNPPAWLSINATDGSLRGTPTQAEVGVLQLVTIRGTDAFGKSIDGSLSITVENVNDAPTLTAIPNTTLMEGETTSIELGPFATDEDPADQANLQMSLQIVQGFDDQGNPVGGQPLPGFMTFNATTKTLNLAPGNSDAGSYLVGVTVTDPGGLRGTRTFLVTITDNEAPVITEIADQTATTGRLFTLNVSSKISDSNNDALTVTALRAGGGELPDWLVFNATTRTFTGTPQAGDVESFVVELRAQETDNANNFDTDQFVINVVSNTAPVVAGIADATNSVGQALSLDVSSKISDANDPAANLTVTATQVGGTPLPAWLTFNTTNRTFSGTPAAGDVGTLNIRVTATDPSNASDTDDFQITVVANQAPVVSTPIADQTATVGTPFSLNINTNFTDPDGNPLTLSVARVGSPTTLPAWLSFNAATGVLSGTPTAADVATLTLRATASDGIGSVSDDFTVTVTAAAQNFVSFTFRTFDTNGT
ncbi:MAG TPA: putative Ig domain-containing protein, partial [Pirellulaceae bacterium]